MLNDCIINAALIVIGVMFGCMGYFLYQIIRIQRIFKIRMKWIKDGDRRYDTCSHKYMADPNKDNWYGFRLPMDKHYKKPGV